MPRTTLGGNIRTVWSSYSCINATYISVQSGIYMLIRSIRSSRPARWQNQTQTNIVTPGCSVRTLGTPQLSLRRPPLSTLKRLLVLDFTVRERAPICSRSGEIRIADRLMLHARQPPEKGKTSKIKACMLCTICWLERVATRRSLKSRGKVPRRHIPYIVPL